MIPRSHASCPLQALDYLQPTGTTGVCNIDRGGCGLRWHRTDYGQTSVFDRYGRPVARSNRTGLT